MRIILPLIVFVCIAFSGSGQNISDTITIVKKGRFHKNEEFLNVNQLLMLMRHNPEAYVEMKQAKTNSTFASILGFAGGFLVGWPIGQAIAGGEPNWGMAGAGAGMIVLSIPLYNSYKNHSTKAVEIYNSGLMQRSQISYEINLYATSKNVGFVVCF